MIIIGLTGGTGAGKTTALRELETLGGYVVDCDELYHDLLETSVSMRQELVKTFGDILTDEKVDRKKLGKQVFRKESLMLKLNRITHRYVERALEEIVENQRLQGRQLLGIDAIALIESGIAQRCNLVVGIISPPEVRVRRIMEREGISEEYAMLRVQAQKPDSYFRRNCDIILENNGEDPEEFARLCRATFSQILKDIKP